LQKHIFSTPPPARATMGDIDPDEIDDFVKRVNDVSEESTRLVAVCARAGEFLEHHFFARANGISLRGAARRAYAPLCIRPRVREARTRYSDA
jgi:hypothetical protein